MEDMPDEEETENVRYAGHRDIGGEENLTLPSHSLMSRSYRPTHYGELVVPCRT